MTRNLLSIGWILALTAQVAAGDANRLAYLDDGCDPYYVHRGFPKLTTPMWVGEEGVEAVVILAIDDMRGPDKWESYLRPILERLKKIDGRAPVSIMTCQVDPQHAHLQTWLKEGVSLECHTYDHPCPLLKDGDFAKAKSTYDRCVDLMFSIPNNKPVAFRTPCCDSLNTNSPRMYAEIFNKTSSNGHFLQVDSSVFNLITADDPALPRELVLDANGSERFRKYVPKDRSLVNIIEDYPYPYLIDNLCWEFPCATPSDWQAQHLHKPNNPITVRDWQAAVDCTVIKQGVFTMVFHPHGWIRSEQIIDLIDHVVARHGKKVKFLTFKEALERLNKNLLGGRALREAPHIRDGGVRLLDLNKDGFMDVVIGRRNSKETRVWSPANRSWTLTSFPTALVSAGAESDEGGARFTILRQGGPVSLLVRSVNLASAEMRKSEAWEFDGSEWQAKRTLLTGMDELPAALFFNLRTGKDGGVRFRDLDGDGQCEAILAHPTNQEVLQWSRRSQSWTRLKATFPRDAISPNLKGDIGLRLLDLNEDGLLDILLSNEERYGIWLFQSMDGGWKEVINSKRQGDVGIPPITINGTNNGFFVRSRTLWWQNENTNLLKDLVARRTFDELLGDLQPGPKSPEQSLNSITVRPGFTVELVAAEPLIADPIGMAWGPDGKLWVVEMGDYPLGTNGKGKFGGNIRFLESTQNDAKYDKSTLFLEGLGYPTGVMPWRKGVLVTCAPEIFYAEDTDGDGKADTKLVLFTGFGEGNQQHRVNGLRWGLDNWIHCANGDSGGLIKSIKTGKTVDIRGRDFRFRPDTGEIEATTGQTQYGRNRDDWDNWFGGNNATPLVHYVLDDYYVRRNPHVAPPDPRVQVPSLRGQQPVYPTSRTLPRFNDFNNVNRFTSACSHMIYRDDFFGSQFRRNAFICEPVHNLVHREVLTVDGCTFQGRRAADEERSEFFSSNDNWCRPTMAQTGPDGGLWICDMYRHVIEHPQWIPKDWQQKLDLRSGHDKGRIYRVLPVDKKPRAIPRLDRLDNASLVAALDSPSGWQRDMAQMLLLWRADPRTAAALEKLALTSHRPETRAQALWTLSQTPGSQTAQVVEPLFKDPHPEVRRQAIKVWESRLATNDHVSERITDLVHDPDVRVRLQLAHTLGEWSDHPRAGKALGVLLVHSRDRFLTAAIMSSINAGNIELVLNEVVRALGEGNPSPSADLAMIVDTLLRMATAMGNKQAITRLLEVIGTPENAHFAAWQFSALAGLLDAIDQKASGMMKLPREGEKAFSDALPRLHRVFAAAREIATSQQASKEDRLAAIRLLGRGPDRHEEDLRTLTAFLAPQIADDLQSVAADTLGRSSDPKAPELLLAGWNSYSPRLRAQVLDAILRREVWISRLLSAIEKKQILPFDIDAARRVRLLDHPGAEVRERAVKAFAGSVNSDRQRVVEEYRPSLTLSGNAQRGQALFTKHCAACHKLGSVGSEVGPNLAALSDKSSEYLLIAILDPNRAVEARYVNYLALTKNGQTLAGLLASETGTSLTLIGVDGKEQPILRSDVEELKSTGKSVMPEGIEKDIRPQDLADLLAFVRANVPLPQRKTFANSRPAVIRPEADGTLRLLATNCEIYGPSLILEDQYQNLGYWNDQEDHAVWTVELPRQGRYAVWLDWACHEGTSGKTYVFSTGSEKLQGRVPGTGDWDTYKQAQIGQIELVSGQNRLVFRSAGKIAGSLIDLRGIKLVPVPPK